MNDLGMMDCTAREATQPNTTYSVYWWTGVKPVHNDGGRSADRRFLKSIRVFPDQNDGT